MKKFIVIVILGCCISYKLNAQSADQLIQINRVANTTDMNNISSPHEGSLVYVESRNNLFLYDGSQWNTIWTNQGNSATDSCFIGTRSNHDFRIRTSNSQRMVVKNDGKVGVNLNNPTGAFQVNTAITTTNNSIGSSGTSSSNANHWLSTGNPLFANDNNNSTHWSSANVSWNYVNYWYRIDLGANNAQVVNKYQIIKQYNFHHPTNWEFQGSNDNTNCINLDIQHGATTWNWGSSITRTFSNSIAYRYYRWFMHRGFQSAPSSWSGGFSIREFKLFASGDTDGTNLADDFIVTTNGNVGIGINPTQQLHVSGNILATGTITPDYVFENYYEGQSERNPNYEFNPLEKVESFVKEHKHLPGVPSAQEVEEQGGIIVNRATEINLEKIEELYLYLIELDKKSDLLQKKAKVLNNESEIIEYLIQSKP